MTRFPPNILHVPYYHDENHYVLSDPKAGPMGPNIGIDGHNLTIAFLSLNRSSLSIRLLESIRKHLVNFAGEVLIGDNGSAPDELDNLKKYLEREFPYRWRLLEFGQNHGVAGGRNRLMDAAGTDWVMLLDNDIYLVANPLATIQRELATLGTHFMSFPLLNPDHATYFARGACLQTLIQEGRPRLTINPFIPSGAPTDAGRGSGNRDDKESPFLCTFLFGGASILNRHSFHRLGGFDDGMFIGFEDIDFSLRLFREGMKVATSSADFLVHDHPQAASQTDDDYERIRFSRQKLRESALYLERKTGFKIWGEEVEEWMRENARKQGWEEEADVPGKASPLQASPSFPTTERPRIALLTDTNDWAFANISRQLKRHLSDRFEFEVFPLVELAEIERRRWFETNCAGHFAEGGASAFGMALVAAEDCDIIHVFWREFLTLIDTPLLADYARRIGFTYEEFRKRFIEGKTFSTCVYDHLHSTKEDIERFERVFAEIVSGYYVSSYKLERIYKGFGIIPAPKAVLPDGVDLGMFRPRNLERFRELPGRPLRVGWVGHSGWAETIEDFKGVHTILKPAIAELQREGAPVELRLADRKEGFIPHHLMADYYAEIDVLVCTSKCEGTPNPVLEAMACGVPVITTDVGIVREALGRKQHEFILEKRDKEHLKRAIVSLIERPERLLELSSENLESIQSWDWAVMARKFIGYFDDLLRPRKLREGRQRSKMCLIPFTNPCMEPDGSMRLCSASSIFDHYEETNMGNCLKEGLQAVWTGERYQAVRRGLLTGVDLKPYCETCEYRHDGPAWMLQLHLALHAWHKGVRERSILQLIKERMDRYEEYAEQAASLGLPLLELPAEARQAAEACPAFDGQDPAELVAPAPLVTCANLPIYMDFNTLNRCNVSCKMCPPAIRFDVMGKKRDPYYRLTLDEYKKITKGMRVETAHFVGAYAEPLLNKEIFDLIEYAKSQGAFTAITTNGTVVGHFVDKIISSGLDMMTLSLHGATRETAQFIMEKSDFDKIIAGMKKLKKARKEAKISKPCVHVNYVVQKENIHEMPDFVDLAEDIGVDHVNFIHLIDGDEAVDKARNPLNFPDELTENLARTRERARERGLSIAISPALQEASDSGINRPDK